MRWVPIALLWSLLASCGREPGSGSAMEDVAPVAQDAGGERTPLLLGHAEGSPGALMEVVEFSDFGCSSCSEFTRRTLPTLRSEFIQTGLIRWRYVPIRQGFLHGGAAARAAECAASQGKFWEMHGVLARDVGEWQGQRDPGPVLSSYAAEIGLVRAAFDACYREAAVDAAIEINDMVAMQLGIVGIPVFLLPDRRIVGALRVDDFRAYLWEALRKKGVTPSRG